MGLQFFTQGGGAGLQISGRQVSKDNPGQDSSQIQNSLVPVTGLESMVDM